MKLTVKESKLAEQFAGPLHQYYGLRLHRCVPMRNVVGVVTDDGYRYIWKPIRSRTILENLPTVAAVVSRLQRLGVEAAGPLATRAGGYLSIVNADYPEETPERGLHKQGRFLQNGQGRLGYLQPWLDGRHVALTDRQERLGSIASICVLHRFTRDIPRGMTVHRTLLSQKYEMKRSFFLTSMSRLAATFPTVRNIEQALLSGVEASRLAIQLTDRSGTSHTLCFCHRDLAAHNLLWQENRVAFIDFDLAALDDSLGDVVQFANHALQHGFMKVQDWNEMTQVYADLARIPNEEIHRLRQLLRFPDVLARATAEWLKTPTPETESRVRSAILVEELRLQLCRGC